MKSGSFGAPAPGKLTEMWYVANGLVAYFDTIIEMPLDAAAVLDNTN